MSQIKFYFYTNLLAPYMFHRWKMISEAYPGSMVILTRKPEPARPWKYRPEEMEFPCVNYPETIKLSNHLLLLIDIWSAEILLHQLYKVCH